MEKAYFISLLFLFYSIYYYFHQFSSLEFTGVISGVLSQASTLILALLPEVNQSFVQYSREMVFEQG